LGDFAESIALRAALGSNIDQAIVSATKSMTGHLLGGAGAVESIFSILALRDRLAPPTPNIFNFDPAIQLNVTRNEPVTLPAGDIAALNNSFGFGGHDVALVFTSL
ncbi:MAG: beta-ketoacyl-ACP synthase, partial [Actinomycetota bacterium]|nr:beta-ketoacyl-ACP synthase [Actinomycetota bacterium]